MRFVENGNVLLMKENGSMDQTVHEHVNFAALNLPDPAGKQFIVRNSDGTYDAIVTPDGQLYLAGGVTEGASDPLTSEAPAFKVASSSNGNVVILIDNQGNLKMTGSLYVEGLPYDLRGHEEGHTQGSGVTDPYLAN